MSDVLTEGHIEILSILTCPVALSPNQSQRLSDMGYTTTFEGQFAFDRELDDKTYELLFKLSTTRRIMRKFKRNQGFGVDGEFYLDEGGRNIVDQIGESLRRIDYTWSGMEVRRS